MKLYLKLLGLIFVGIVAISALDGLLQIRRETGFYREEIWHDAELLGHVLTSEIIAAWEQGGQERVRQLVKSANRADSRVRFRWVWFDAAPGDEDAPWIEKSRQLPADAKAFLSVERKDGHGESRLFSYFPVPLPETRPGGLEISESLSGLKLHTKKIIQHIVFTTLISTMAIGIILAAGSFWLLAAPLRLIMRKTREIGAGHLENPLRLDRRDEMGELAAAVNSMAAQLLVDRNNIRQETQSRLEAVEQLRHADRLRSVGRLASGIAHELGTPLNVISGRAGLIASDKSATADIAGSAETIRGQCRRITLIIRELLDFSRNSASKRVLSDLNEIISRTTSLLAPLALKNRVKIVYSEPGHPAMAHADPTQIEQVLTNLLTNAIQAMPQGGQAWVDIAALHAQPPLGGNSKEGEFYAIRVRDEGIGISPGDMPHIFDPFFTTKASGEGTGLGLSISHGIVAEHGGWIQASSEAGRGSVFSVYLPRAKEKNDDR
jgi:signal transduction histidine kinase